MEPIHIDAACLCGSGLTVGSCCGASGGDASKVRARVTCDGGIEAGTLTPNVVSSMEHMAAVPDIFPVSVDFAARSCRLVKMSPRWYRESVFLDPLRIIGKYAFEMDLSRLASIADATPWRATPIIFHTAFCGSTLMSQALAGAFECLPLREPDILGNVMFYARTVGASEWDGEAWLGRSMRLLSRRYSDDQPVVVKANDYANELMLRWLRRQVESPILFMYTPLDEFVTACLRAENRRPWIVDRYRMIRAAAPPLIRAAPSLNLGDDAYAEMAAVYWVNSLVLYLDAFRFDPRRVRCVDFNQMLNSPVETVAACGRFFGLTASRTVDLATAVNEVFGVYSKNTQVKYSPRQRADDVRQLKSTFHAQIAAAEALARRLLGREYPEPALPGALIADKSAPTGDG